MVQSPAYDNDSRVTGINYGTNGSCTNQTTDAGSLTYSYDNDSRITGIAGARAALNLPSAVTGNTYGNTNKITAWNGVAATSDAANNLTLDPSNSAPYAWNERNQLASVSSPNYLFNYDARGLRESFNDFGTIQSYLYDALMAVQETSSNTQSVPTHNYLTMPGGEVLVDYATVGNATTAYMPLHDVLGSTIGLLSTAGFTTYSYEPFGKPTASGPPSSFPYLFASMEYDAATGLYHTPARYYSPTLQRFLSEDPLQFGGGDTNLFAYVQNDPIDYADPSGLDPVSGGDIAELQASVNDVGMSANQIPRNQETRAITGKASFYRTGHETANGEPFYPNGFSAAMHLPKSQLGRSAKVTTLTPNPNSVRVWVNDTGPWDVYSNGRLKEPIQPRPGFVIDLSNEAFITLVGDPRGRVGVVGVRVELPGATGQAVNAIGVAGTALLGPGDHGGGSEDTAGIDSQDAPPAYAGFPPAIDAIIAGMGVVAPA